MVLMIRSNTYTNSSSKLLITLLTQMTACCPHLAPALSDFLFSNSLTISA